MSIAAALIAYAFWNGLHRCGVARHLGLLENNINQTSASSAASILSAGLVAPIPALTLLTGTELAWSALAIWIFCVSLLGVFVALAIRRQMLFAEDLPFPNGVATAETVREIYAEGREAFRRIRILGTGIFLSGTLKLLTSISSLISSLKFPATVGFSAPAAVSAQGVQTVSLTNLGIAINPSLLLIGFGAIIGPRVGISLVLGAVLAWLWIGPVGLAKGWISPGPNDPTSSWFETMNEWLLWPGVTLMVVASLASVAISLGQGLRSRWQQNLDENASENSTSEVSELPGKSPFRNPYFIVGLLIASIGVIACQYAFFAIPIWTGFLAVILTFVLAVVAARVSGETGIPPIGALGKITQLSFGVIAPGNVTTNLMAANVTGGAAGQCSDLLHDFRTGQLIGASAHLQTMAQCFGILSGALFGSAAYLILIPDPASMLISEEWPAPAVVTWKAVAEVMRDGLHTFPPASLPAMVIAGGIGVVLAILEKCLRGNWRKFVPSAPSIGFAFIIPASLSLTMGLGSILAILVTILSPEWKKRYLIVLAAGFVAGESLMGVCESLISLLS